MFTTQSSNYYCKTIFQLQPGSGIGPEMMQHVQKVFKVAGAPVDFEMVHLDPNTENYDDLHNVKYKYLTIKGNYCNHIIIDTFYPNI